MLLKELFFELIQVAIGSKDSLSSTPNDEEWESIYELCLKQALIGIAYSGVERLPKDQRPKLATVWTWNEDTKQIEERNKQNQKRCNLLLHHLSKDGLEGVILKGQSNLVFYPTHLQERRIMGDIDVWITRYSHCHNVNQFHLYDIIKYCMSLIPKQYLCYIHYDFPVFSDIHVEAHIRPSFLCNPLYNHRLQNWFNEQRFLISDSKLSPEQTQMICLLHIYKHLFEEGIGLRQLMDYYFIIQSPELDLHSNDKLIESLGMNQFVADLEYVMNKVFGRFKENRTTLVHSKRGEFLINEIMTGGNFGQYDPRIKHEKGVIRHAVEKTKHNLRLLRYYPTEVFWEPIFRLYHWSWRTFELWRWE